MPLRFLDDASCAMSIIGSAALRSFDPAGLAPRSVAAYDAGATCAQTVEPGGTAIGRLRRAATLPDDTGQLIERLRTATFDELESDRASRTTA